MPILYTICDAPNQYKFLITLSPKLIPKKARDHYNNRVLANSKRRFAPYQRFLDFGNPSSSDQVLIGSSSSSQPQVTSSRQPTSSVQSEQAYVVRRQHAQLETQLSQQNVVASKDDPLTTQPDESGQMEYEDISKGRGAARSIPQWGTRNILHVSFDLEWKLELKRMHHCLVHSLELQHEMEKKFLLYMSYME
ncbi:unnamed protein product [Prunus armeniaca]